MSSTLLLVPRGPPRVCSTTRSPALQHNAVSRAEVEVAQASVLLAHDWEMPKLRARPTSLPAGTFTWYAGSPGAHPTRGTEARRRC
jgi:hypothetical protein